MTVRHLSDAEIVERVEDVVLASDRIFFEQHPRRSFRIRPAWDVEIEDFARHAVIQRTLPAGLCWWVAVHQVHRGFRMRFPLAAPHHFPTEVPEADARHVWNRRCPSLWKKRLQRFKRNRRLAGRVV